MSNWTISTLGVFLVSPVIYLRTGKHLFRKHSRCCHRLTITARNRTPSPTVHMRVSLATAYEWLSKEVVKRIHNSPLEPLEVGTTTTNLSVRPHLDLSRQDAENKQFVWGLHDLRFVFRTLPDAFYIRGNGYNMASTHISQAMDIYGIYSHYPIGKEPNTSRYRVSYSQVKPY